MLSPANYLEFNVLDLVLFNSLQSLQHETVSSTIAELTHAVNTSYIKLPKEKITCAFQTLKKYSNEL